MIKRQHVASVFAEALGTAALTMILLAVSRSAIGIPYFVALGLGLTQAVLILMLIAHAGVHLNPGVTLGLWSARKVSTARALLYIAAQFLGAYAAFSLFKYLLQRPLPEAAEISFSWPIFVAEMTGAALLAFGFTAAVVKKYNVGQTAATVGGVLAVGMIAASVNATGSIGLINPAVALGVESWAKAYVLGPLVGGLVGVNLYTMLFAGENPIKSVSTKAKKTTKKSKK